MRAARQLQTQRLDTSMEAQGCPVTNGCCVSQAELLQSVVGQGPEVAPEHVHEEAVDAPRPQWRWRALPRPRRRGNLGLDMLKLSDLSEGTSLAEPGTGTLGPISEATQAALSFF